MYLLYLKIISVCHTVSEKQKMPKKYIIIYFKFLNVQIC